MTQAEKARSYDEALEMARKIHNETEFDYEKCMMEEIFPELAKSEDEQMIKALSDGICDIAKDYGWSDFGGIPIVDVLDWLEKQGEPVDKGEVSDGYHTFNELYYYRMLYNAAFFNMLPNEWVHKSKKHHDGEECFGGGWFIVMANLPTGQISNHYELKDWELFKIPEKDVADEWDGHTPKEAAERLHKYLLEKQGEQKTIWHNEDEEPKRGSLILLIMQSGTAIVAKIIEPNHTFNHGERWAYIDDLLEKKGSPVLSNSSNIGKNEQESALIRLNKFKVGDTIINRHCRWDGSYRIREITDCKYIFDDGSYITTKEQDDWELVDKVKPKFKIGDTMRTLQEANDGYTDGMPVVVSIDNEYYHCTNELIAIKDQEDYEFPPINMKQKPMFKVGDWICTDMCVVHIASIENGLYYFDEGNSLAIVFADKYYHLWSIEDAKGGDVLVDEDNNMGIYKKIEGLCWHSYIYLGCDNRLYGFSIGGSHEQNNTKPATKEQRNILMKAMKDAGYTFDFEKKELKKIENRRPLLSDFFSAEYERGKEDALKCIKWNAEDDVKLQRIIDFLWYNRKGDTDTIYQQEQDIDWLKSLKERYAWKPDDEQMEALEPFVRSIGESGYTSTYDNNTKLLYSLLSDLKKLKE